MAIDILVPTLGESVTEATLAKWFKAVGDTVAADEPLAELETDKVSLEVNAPAAGVLMEIRVPEGADVGLGAVLGVLKEGTAVSATVPAPTPATELVPAPVPQPVGNDPVDIVVPTLGESVTEATVGELLKNVGDAVAVLVGVLEHSFVQRLGEVPGIELDRSVDAQQDPKRHGEPTEGESEHGLHRQIEQTHTRGQQQRDRPDLKRRYPHL